MGEQRPPENGNEVGHVVSESLNEALSKRFLSYAMSTITARALPDVRDGLKPVHRRILYAMRQMKLDPKSGPKKCAKVIGEVMGNYHPHGDVAIYDALVRLAQDFSVRYPLVFGQGNFGNIDGDGAAAMRYTEAKLTEIAEKLMEGINEDAVDFRPTYDGEEHEPIVLPAGYPNLLANGSAGIAVGMATNIPTHNVSEVLDACLLMIEGEREPSIEDLIEIIPGPDFPTGGVIVDPKQDIVDAYKTGKGSFRLRAKWHEEKEGRQKKIIVTEIPFQVQKTKLVDRIGDLLDLKKLPLLGDVRDESSEEIRLVLEPKNSAVDLNLLMESLFKLTDLESKISLNMNVLTDRGRTPRVLNLVEILSAFLDHRREVLVRRAHWRLDKIDKRLHILDALLIVFQDLDEVIRIIREEDHPKIELMKRFLLSDTQAEAILETKLRSLRKIEEISLKEEQRKLTTEKAELSKLVKNEKRQWEKIAADLKQTKELFSLTSEVGRRRTTFDVVSDVPNMSPEAFVEREPVTVILSERGWIKALRGHNIDGSGVKFKDGDKLGFSIETHTTQKITFVGTSGRFFNLSCDKLPSGRGQGEPLRLALDLEEQESIINMYEFDPKRQHLVVSSSGRGFLVFEEHCEATKRSGKNILNLDAHEELVLSRHVEGDHDHIALIGEDKKLLIFLIEELPQMTKGKGVKLKGGKDNAVRDVKFFHRESGLYWQTSSGRNHEVKNWPNWLGKRAQVGRNLPPGFPKSAKFG